MRLINPDNIEASSEQKLTKELKAHSRENLNNAMSIHKSQPDVLIGMSRSTTSSASSPLQNDFRRSQDDVASHLSPSKVKIGLTFNDEFPLPEDSDWPSLVDTATSFMNQVGSSSDVGKELERNHRRWNEEGAVDASITSS